MAGSRRIILDTVLVLSVLATVLVYVVMVPREIRAGGDPVAYFIGGWIPYTMAFYALGHRFGPADRLPSMRAADGGAILVVLSVLVSVAMASWGFTPERVPEAHAIQALAVFVGLALFAWGIGQRSAAIESLSR